MSLVTELIKAGGGGTSNSYSKDEVYTKDQVNTTVGQAIEALKKDQSWINNSSSGGSNDTTSPEGVISSNGNMELTLERSVEEEVWLDDGVSQSWRFTVRNKGSSGTYFRINANFDVVDEAVDITSCTLTPDYSASSGVIFNPNNTFPSTKVSNISFTSAQSSSSSKIWIGKGREESLYVTIKIDYTTVTGKRWNWDFTIRELN
jgi:hypothetical protein